MNVFTVACVQLTSGSEIATNIAAATELIRRAKAEGAEFVLTPETTDLIARRSIVLDRIRPEAEHEGLAAFCELAAELGIWLLVGSLLVRLNDGGASNRSFLIDRSGNIAVRYDKIHMFDVEIPDGQSYRESAIYRPGDRAVIADLPWGRLGLTVCYDLRFPQLYRALAHGGADFLSVPSAFTRLTGQAHWHVLLRARAIETGCFIFAPAQCGEHAGGRQTYGQSLIVDPWGQVLAEAGREPGTITVRIATAKVAEARRMVPALDHDRSIIPPNAAASLRQAGE